MTELASSLADSLRTGRSLLSPAPSEGPTVTRAGLIYLVPTEGAFSGTKLVCASVAYTMAVNMTHTVRALLTAGDGIAEGDRSRPAEAILDLLRRLSESGSSGLVGCDLYEETSDGRGRLLILRGFIVAARLVSQTSGSGNISVSVVCSGSAARLMVRPMGIYTESTMGGLLTWVRGGLPINQAGAAKTSIKYGKAAFNLGALVKDFMNGRGRTIRELVSFCVRKTRYDNTYQALSEGGGESRDRDVDDALSGDMKVTGELSADSLNKYYTGIIGGLSGALRSGHSIYEALVGVLNSDDYLISLVPRWNNGFRLELTPSTHWLEGGRSRRIRLDSSHVFGLTVDLKSMSQIDVPDAVILTSDPAGGMSLGKAGIAPVYGAAARDPKLQGMLRQTIHSFRGSGEPPDLGGMARDGSLLKFTEILAPPWFAGVITAPGYLEQPDRDNRSAARVEMAPRLIADEKSQGDTEQVVPSEAMLDFSDNYASHILYSRYLLSDSAEVQLDPSLRFGRAPGERRLEDCLGMVVELDLTRMPSKAATGFRLIGVLTGLNYSYTTGNASRMSYAMTLSRIQVVDSFSSGTAYDGVEGLKPFYVDAGREKHA